MGQGLTTKGVDYDKKKETIRDRMKAWYLGRMQEAPDAESFAEILRDILEDIEEIPADHLSECWAVAKRGNPFIPKGCDLLNAWKATVRPTIVQHHASDPTKRDRHECIYCAVVTIRLGGYIPEASDWEKATAAAPPTQREIACALARLNGDNVVFSYWALNPKSPYKGLL